MSCSHRLRSLATARTLRWADWRELVTTVLLVPVVEVGVRRIPLPRLTGRIGIRLECEGSTPSVDVERLPQWARRRAMLASCAFAHLPVRVTCLRRSLIVGQRLRALQPSLCLGAERVDGRLEAHAWLEVGGVRLDTSARRYGVLSREPSPA